MASESSPAGKRIRLELAEYLSSESWAAQGLSKPSVSAVVEVFLECCYEDLGSSPEKLDEPELSQILFEILPARLGSRQEGAAKAPEIIERFLGWKSSSTLNPNAWKFGALFERAQREFPSLLKQTGGSAIREKDSKPFVRPGSKVGRNDPCPCGSGKKYKKCCG